MTVNPSKYLLYNDPLVGVMDAHAYEGLGGYYERNGKILRSAADSGGKFSYIADYLASLCDILELKADLGVKLKRAYEENDRAFLQDAALRILPNIKERTAVFYRKYSDAWLKENKSVGLEIIQIRLGGLMQRAESCALIIKEYLDGKRERIETLERERQPYYSASLRGQDIFKREYADIVTGSVL